MKKLIKNSFLAIIVLLTLQACNDNEPELIFKDVPAVRLEKQAKELQDLLKSSTDGWKATYFTDNTQLGGYSYLFKFTDNNTVEMASDFGGNDDVTSSQWALQTGATLKLSFTTKNKIHELSDSNNSPDADLTGQGYKGSFEFLYYGTEGDDIIFRTNRDFIELRFTKANASSWTNLDQHQINIDKIKKNPAKSVFRVLKVKDKQYSFLYNPLRRFLTSEIANFGVGFTETGIIISPSLDIDGEKVSEFTYDSINDSFVAKINDIEVASIVYIDTAPVLNPYDFGNTISGNDNIRLYATIFTETDDSAAFTSFLDDLRAHFTNTQSGRTITRLYIYDLDKAEPYLEVRYLSSGSSFTIRYPLTFIRSQDSLGNIIIKFTETIPVNTNRRTGILPFLEYLTRSTGFYVEKRADRSPTSATLGLIAVDDFTLMSHWYDF